MFKKLMLVGLLMSNNVYTMSPEEIAPKTPTTNQQYVRSVINLTVIIAICAIFGSSCGAPDIALSAGN